MSWQHSSPLRTASPDFSDAVGQRADFHLAKVSIAAVLGDVTGTSYSNVFSPSVRCHTSDQHRVTYAGAPPGAYAEERFVPAARVLKLPGRPRGARSERHYTAKRDELEAAAK